MKLYQIDQIGSGNFLQSLRVVSNTPYGGWKLGNSKNKKTLLPNTAACPRQLGKTLRPVSLPLVGRGEPLLIERNAPVELKVVQNYEGQELPSKSELNCIRPGLFVRLQLKSGSRFWCRADSRQRPNGTFSGIADDTAPPVKRGDLIVFEKKHVFEVL